MDQGEKTEARYRNKLQIPCKKLSQMMAQSRRFSQGLHKPPPALAELKPIWIGNNISLRSTPMPLVVGIYKQNILFRLFS